MEGHGAEPIDGRDLAPWRDALGRVLGGRDLDIVTQPIVDLQVGSVVGYEALTRFPGSPSADSAAWFAAADEFGVSPELMAVTLRRQLALAEHLPPGCLLAVKVSGLVLDAATVQPVFEQSPLARVVVELDEPGHVGGRQGPADLVDLADLVRWLRHHGARIAVTSEGHDAVAVIREIDPDIVRIERPLIAHIETDAERRALVAEVQTLLEARGARLLAHGIETRGELDALIDVGVPLGQGYFIGRPAPGWARPARFRRTR